MIPIIHRQKIVITSPELNWLRQLPLKYHIALNIQGILLQFQVIRRYGMFQMEKFISR